MTVYLVGTPVWQYNDEKFYQEEGEDILYVTEDEEKAAAFCRKRNLTEMDDFSDSVDIDVGEDIERKIHEWLREVDPDAVSNEYVPGSTWSYDPQHNNAWGDYHHWEWGWAINWPEFRDWLTARGEDPHDFMPQVWFYREARELPDV